MSAVAGLGSLKEKEGCIVNPPALPTVENFSDDAVTYPSYRTRCNFNKKNVN